MAESTATGVLEVRGMATLVAGVDVMLKAADVRLCGRHGVGSGWVTAVVEGDVAAVQTALRVGREEAEKHGDVIAAHVVARPEPRAMEALPHRAAAGEPAELGPQALGLLETQGIAPLVQGADAMVKAARVELVGWAFIGGALNHVMVRGDVAAVQTAVQVGRDAAEEAGSVHATLVVPQPVDGMGALLPPRPDPAASSAGALGVLETTGYVSAVAGTDAMSKAAEVQIRRLCLGSGGRVAALIQGGLADVQAAVDSGADAARQAGGLESARVVSRPAPEVTACFAGAGAGVEGSGAEAGGPADTRAMGLIETRSTVALVKAVDEMLKAAEVEYVGREKVGYYLTASVIRGDVGAVRVALDVGAAEAAKHGDTVSVHLIPYPFPEMVERLPH